MPGSASSIEADTRVGALALTSGDVTTSDEHLMLPSLPRDGAPAIILHQDTQVQCGSSRQVMQFSPMFIVVKTNKKAQGNCM